MLWYRGLEGAGSSHLVKDCDLSLPGTLHELMGRPQCPSLICQLRWKRLLGFALATSAWRKGLCRVPIHEATEPRAAQLGSQTPCSGCAGLVPREQCCWGRQNLLSWCLPGGLTPALLPLSPQASPAAESHPGVLPAGEPAQHGERVHPHLGDLRAGEG